MQIANMINALVKTQHTSAICNFWSKLQIFCWLPDPAYPSPWILGWHCKIC